MNKYQKAFNTITNTLICYMIRRDLYPLPSDDEIYNAQRVLLKLVDKAESFEWIPFEREDGFIICHIDTEDGFLRYQIPNVGEKILVTDGKRVWEDTWIEYDNGYAFDSNYDLAEVTAWMPLSEPYREEEND